MGENGFLEIGEDVEPALNGLKEGYGHEFWEMKVWKTLVIAPVCSLTVQMECGMMGRCSPWAHMCKFSWEGKMVEVIKIEHNVIKDIGNGETTCCILGDHEFECLEKLGVV